MSNVEVPLLLDVPVKPQSQRYEWFQPKLYGYGSGLPIAWQGWAVLLAYMILTLSGALIFLTLLQSDSCSHGSFVFVLCGIYVVYVLLISIPFIIICKRTTRGGWKWRWNGEE